MDTLEILQKGRALIADPENWKRGGLAEVNETNDTIVGPYCALGAIGKTCEIFALGRNGGRTGRGGFFATHAREKNHGNMEAEATYKAAEKALRECIPDESVHDYNDSHSHECAVRLFDAAIEKIEQEQCSPR